jgi:hypothetical protein
MSYRTEQFEKFVLKSDESPEEGKTLFALGPRVGVTPIVIGILFRLWVIATKN